MATKWLCQADNNGAILTSINFYRIYFRALLFSLILRSKIIRLCNVTCIEYIYGMKFICLGLKSKFYSVLITTVHKMETNWLRYLQSAAGLVASLVTLDSVNLAGHHVLETVCPGTSFLFCRVPLPTIWITVLPQGRREHQAKFVTCNRNGKRNDYTKMAGDVARVTGVKTRRRFDAEYQHG